MSASTVVPARERTWPIGKMLTQGCARTLERAVAALPGVHSAVANYASGFLQIEYDPASIKPNVVAEAVRRCGFDCNDEIAAIDTPPAGHAHSAPARDAAADKDQPARKADVHDGMHHGDDLHAAARDMRRRFFVALIFGIVLFVWSPMGLFEPPPTPFRLEKQVWLFLIASAALLYPGWPFFTAAIRSLRHGVFDMAVLVLVSVGTGYLFSIGATFFFTGADFYEATTVLLIFVLLGHWLEMRARAGASDAMKSLLKLSPPRALVRRGSDEVEIPTDEVVVGDLLVVRPGAKIPVDGEVTEGSTQVDESMLTGESMPVRKDPGSQVVGGAINKSGAFVYRATKVGADTALSQIIKLVQDAQNSKAPAQLLADRASQWLVIAAIVIGLLTFAVWFSWMGQSLLFAVTLTITVFVIACPDALGLATPMAIMIGTGLAARHGILFKRAEAIEQSARLDVVIFDKTGTLTVGNPEVVEVVAASGHDEQQVLALAAAVDAHSQHPLAQAILKRAGKVEQRAADFNSIDGRGATGTVDGQRVLVGNRLLMDDSGVAIGLLEQEAARLQGGGRTVVHVGLGTDVVGLIAIADAIRPSSRAAIDALHERKVKVAMITGDNRATAERVAAELGIDIVLADVLPGGKADEVKKLQAQGKRVGMVGDGVNDAPALTQAEVGFAIGAGTDVAIDSADIVLMRSDPYDVVRAIGIARGTVRKMHQNLAWAVGYNILAFPLAAGVLYPFVLSPEIAALSMSGSSIIVAVNALLLKRMRLDAQSPATPDAEASVASSPRLMNGTLIMATNAKLFLQFISAPGSLRFDAIELQISKRPCNDPSIHGDHHVEPSSRYDCYRPVHDRELRALRSVRDVDAAKRAYAPTLADRAPGLRVDQYRRILRRPGRKLPVGHLYRRGIYPDLQRAVSPDGGQDNAMNRVLPSFLLQRAIAGQMSAPLKARLNWPRSFQSESLVASDGVLEGVDTAIVASLVDAIANNVRVSRVRIEDSAQR